MSGETPPLDLTSEPAQLALAGYLAQASAAMGASITGATRLGGGAIHENWRIDARFDGGGSHPGPQSFALRAAGDAPLAESHSVEREFAVARAAFKAGVTVPEPLWCCDDASVIGRVFSLSRFTEGVAAGHLLVRDESLGGGRAALLGRLGEELARIQTITPQTEDSEPIVTNLTSSLKSPQPSPALAAITDFRAALDEHPTPRPALEWGLRWLERNAPPGGDLVLVHGDFRTGNFIVDEAALRGILDWEFARWGDPLDDVGWFTARCWRFNRYDRPAGGLGSREDFARAYEAASGRALPIAAVHYWEVMAHVRWAVIAIHQGERHTSGRQPSLELALTGRIPDELELEILTLIEEAEQGQFDV